MKTRILCLCGLTLSLLAAGPRQQQEPIPPGLVKAKQKANIPPEPPLTPRRSPPDPAQLRRNADELAKLAQSIPAEIDQLTTGRLPKDLTEKLKRIEKLAKHLRSALSP